MPIIWRDDDILIRPHTLAQLLRVDDLLQRAGQSHTIAIIASTLTDETAAAIRERRMIAQLHCWKHDDLSIDEDAVAELPMSIARIEDMIGQRPTVLYPPWNRTSPMLERAAAALGLAVSHEKVSLDQYIRFRGKVREPVNFHFWHEPDVDLLEVALAI